MRFPTPAEREKRARLAELLDEGLVTVHLDARHPDVDVPAHLKGELSLALNLSHRFRLSVFELGPLAIKANLSFHGDRHLCILPWAAIFMLTSRATERRLVFVDDAPEELKGALEAAALLAREAEEAALSVARPEAPVEDQPEPEPPPPEGGNRPRLRLVK